MSRENVEVARRVFVAVAARDLAALLELCDPDVEWRSFFADVGTGGEYRGADGLHQYVADLTEAWEVLQAEVHDMLDAGDVVIGVGRLHYRGKESGVESASDAGWMFKLRDGKVLTFRAFREPTQVLEAVGLPPRGRE